MQNGIEPLVVHCFGISANYSNAFINLISGCNRQMFSVTKGLMNYFS